MVTLSDESVEAVAASLDRSLWSKRDSSFLPTPDNVFVDNLEEEEKEEMHLQVAGSAMALDPRIQARQHDEQVRGAGAGAGQFRLQAIC